MFDLFRSRDKAVRILLGVILGVVAISMVTYLIPGTGGGSATGDDGILATVGDDKVTTQAALESINRTMKGRQLPPEMVGYFAPQVVQGLITERALGYEAKRLGIQVSDDDVSNMVKQQVPASFYKPDGSLDQEILANALSQQNMTIPAFLDEIRRTLLIQRLRQIVVDGIVVTKADVAQEFRRRNEKIKVEYVLVKPAMLEQQVQVTPAEVDAYFKKNQQTYQTPEKKSMDIILLSSAKVEQSINPSDAELQSAYNANVDRFRSPERVKVRHILLKTNPEKKGADGDKDDALVRAKAADLLKQLKAGADFADMAKKNSQDTVSAAKGGDLDWVTRGQMVKPFEDATFSTPKGEFSGLIKTVYGYHILQVQDKEPARVKPFDEVKGILAAEYRTQRANQKLQQLGDQARVELKKDPAHPEKAAAAVGGELIKVENLKPGDPIPQLGISQPLQTGILGLKKGDISQAIATTPNQLAIVLITALTPAHPASLDEVRPQVETAVRRQRVDDLVQKKANDLAAKAKASNGDLTKAAKDLGLESKTSNDFDRQGAIEGFGSASVLNDAFTAKDGTIVGPVNSADGKAVVQVLSHMPADMTKLAGQETTFRDELKGKVTRERLGLFEDGVRKRLEAEGKVKVRQDALNRLLQKS